MEWVGFVASLFIWGLLSAGSLMAALYLHREKVLSEKWLLLVPFLLTSLVFFGIRYRFADHFFTFEQIHQFFAIGSYRAVDVPAVLVCLPAFYAISVLRPDWVVRFWVNVPLLIFLPFAIKLVIYLSGMAPWDPHPGSLQPTRVE